MAETSQVKITAFYDRDTYRTHRYLIETAEGISGSIYINKDVDVPKELIIKLEVKEA